MKITLENKYSTVTVEIPGDDMILGQILDDLIVPALQGFGFGRETINQHIVCDV